MLIKLLDLCSGGERGGRVVLCPWVGLLTLTLPFPPPSGCITGYLRNTSG